MTVAFNPQYAEDVNQTFQSFFAEEDKLSGLIKELNKKQTDERGYFIQYSTTSTEKPHVWERFDAHNSVKPAEYAKYFEYVLNELVKHKEHYGWTGIKLVAFSVDSLNIMQGINILKHYCFEEVSVKKKNYINGKNASQEFLAKKGKIYTNEKTV